jgi:hypothetical protein
MPSRGVDPFLSKDRVARARWSLPCLACETAVWRAPENVPFTPPLRPGLMLYERGGC